ncbi:MAG: SpoIID/LytB domain-containing protein [Acaryochloridaceae cyanobacterium SU_2_1]|nr:SpoIID/LytB domain-containing protein [Acaryochloridaceae cyanobacterium SU_2_1]
MILFLRLLLGSKVLRLSGLSLFFWVCTLGPALALELRVALSQGKDQLVIGSSTAAKVVDGQGKTVATLPALQGFFAKTAPGAVAFHGQKAWQFLIQPSQGGFVYIGDRWYRGQVRLVTTQTGITAINEVNLEDYLASVVGKEMYTSWPLESLKAQAVAARSFALFRRNRQKTPLYDLVNTTKDQVYGGIDGEAESTRTAVKATAGQVMTYQGAVIEALFHANSGGHTEDSEQVYSSVIPYLRGVPDFDQEAPNFEWSTTFTAAQLKSRIPGIGNIRSITVQGRTAYQRVKTVKIVGDSGSKVLSGRELRQALDLKSTLFSIVPQGNPSQATAFAIQGRGHGHGLGMSQWGALALAKQGKNYQQILQHFYRNVAIQTLN